MRKNKKSNIFGFATVRITSRQFTAFVAIASGIPAKEVALRMNIPYKIIRSWLDAAKVIENAIEHWNRNAQEILADIGQELPN